MSKQNQHYVPQFYLKKFAVESNELNQANRIFVFDKDTNEIDLKHIKKVASSPGFYDFHSGINDLNRLNLSAEDLSAFEELLWLIESVAGNIFKDLEDKTVEHFKDPENKKHWSEFLVLQSARTLKMRNIILNSGFDLYGFFNLGKGCVEQCVKKKQDENLLRYLKSFEIFKKESVAGVTTGFEVPILHYAFFYLSIYLVSENFTNRKWEVGVNQTNIPFCTSDHPVAISPYSKVSPYLEGTEILFPVNPKLILILKGEQATSEDCCIVHLDENQVREYNKRQIYSSEQCIFSKNNNFEWAKQICNSTTS